MTIRRNIFALGHSASPILALCVLLLSCAEGTEEVSASNGDAGFGVETDQDSATQDDSRDASETGDVQVDQAEDPVADQAIDQAEDVAAGLCSGKTDGTVCGAGSACSDEAICQSELCVKKPKPDSTVCEAAKGICHEVGTCMSGACQASAPKANGTSCGAADPCHNASTCESGTCVVHNKADGTVCLKAPDACHSDGLCKAGSCGAVGTHPEGYNWKAGDLFSRCCGGQALRMDTNDHCNVCGIKCNLSNGETCKINTASGQYYCTGCLASAACWSGCCSTGFTDANRCAASDCKGNCANCPAGTSCHTYANSGVAYASNMCTY